MEAVAESTFTAKQAAAWVGRVNANLANLAHLITDGYQHRVWEALGYQSWAEMCEAEVNVPQLSRDQRRELVGSLRSEGMSTRAIAAATGTSQMTAQRDVEAGESNDSPANVVGLDGKQYQPVRRETIDHEDWLFDDDDNALPVSNPDLVPKPEAPITKPDLGGGVSHPARFSDAIIERFAGILEELDGEGYRVLDPFAGTGRVHELDRETVGIELEPEWAAMHPDTICGTALDLPFPDKSFDVIATSPTYGNRLADSHNASDPELRRSYTHDLGHALSDDNSGAMQWGERYREFHEAAWTEAIRVLVPNGWFLLNIKDHIRGGEQMPVAAWHVATLVGLGLTFDPELSGGVPTRHLRQGTESERAGQELVLMFIKEQ